MANDLSAGRRVKALDFPKAVQVYDSTAISNISSTVYITGSPEVAVRFMAPSSGRVAVSLTAGTSNNGANADRVFVTFRVYEGDPDDGTLLQIEEASRGVCNAQTGSDDFQFHGQATMVDGMTPGVYYYIQMLYRTTLGSSTADLAHRGIMVWPIP